MSKKNIILIISFILILIIIAVVFFVKSEKKFDYKKDDNKTWNIPKMVDADDTKNVELKDNIKTNISKKVVGTTKAAGVSESDIDGKVYITDVKIEADIEKDTCDFYGIAHNDTGVDIKKLFLNMVFYSDDDKIKYGIEYFCNDLKTDETCEIKFSSGIDISNISYYTVDYSAME